MICDYVNKEHLQPLFTNVCQRISGGLDEELLRRSSAGHGKQRLSPMCRESSVLWGKGWMRAEQRRCILIGCSGVAFRPSLGQTFSRCVCSKGSSWMFVAGKLLFTCIFSTSQAGIYRRVPALGRPLHIVTSCSDILTWCLTRYILCIQLVEACVNKTFRNFCGRGRGTGSPVDESPAHCRALEALGGLVPCSRVVWQCSEGVLAPPPCYLNT